MSKEIKKNEGLRNQIIDLEKAMREISDTKDDINFPVTHHFASGVYAREIFLPKDSLVVGKIHKHDHMNIISSGKVSVSTEEGNKIIEAPCTFVSPAGTKRAVCALEDTVWTTIHVTKETDLEKIEDETIAKSFDEYFSLEERKKIGVMP